jgi:murein DD-endopeptidase MepM/ murein hydrolase activator NlpD
MDYIRLVILSLSKNVRGQFKRPFDKLRVTTFVLLFSLSSFAQHPKDFFRSPLDIPLFLSGNFGEIRSNHFHSGLDIKTQSVEGKRVYAPADGYVSRIKIQAGGYGNALYVTHANGYTTVYGHLSAYNDSIAKYVKAEQYKKESFEIELFPDSNLFRYKKGDVIAYTGNTGSSGGPHLHFEIRDTKTESTFNPLFFGFEVKDKTPPAITSLAVYSFDENARKGPKNRKVYTVTKTGGKYVVNGGNPLPASGITGFGLEVYDQLDGADNKNGAYSIELMKDSSRIYFHRIDEMPFHLSRFINSHIDYEEKKLNSNTIQKSFVEPGNQLKIYETKISAGKTLIEQSKKYTFRYSVKDVAGNTSILEFTVEGTKPLPPILPDSIAAKTFYFDSINTFQATGMELQMPDFALYRDIDFMYSSKNKTKQTYSAIHSIHRNTEPLQRDYMLSIAPDSVPEKLKDKLLIVSFNSNNNPVSEGGKFKNDTVTTKTKSFGSFAVMADTIKPKITPVNITRDGDLSAAKTIKVKISDNLSGIAYYRGSIDGKWVLMEYDAKNSLLTYTFDYTVPKGKRWFELTVSDGKQNTTKYEAHFHR